MENRTKVPTNNTKYKKPIYRVYRIQETLHICVYKRVRNHLVPTHKEQYMEYIITDSGHVYEFQSDRAPAALFLHFAIKLSLCVLLYLFRCISD